MSVPKTLLCVIALAVVSHPMFAQSGLNTIPTTNTVHIYNIDTEMENSNTSFDAPSFFHAPSLGFITEFGLVRRVEGGVAWAPAEDGHRVFEFNLKGVLTYEGLNSPGSAIGITSWGKRLPTTYFLTLSRTLNYMQEKGHHHLSQRVNGHRLHGGVLVSGNTVQPFLGLEWEVSQAFSLRADWTRGSGNVASLGFEYVFPDDRTAVNPFLLFSNDQHRIDGFVFNVSYTFDFTPKQPVPAEPGGTPGAGASSS